MLNTAYSDFEFAKTLGVKMISGRDLPPSFATDSTVSVLINRTAASFLGYTPEGLVGAWIKNIQRDSTRRRIIGVVEDFNFAS